MSNKPTVSVHEIEDLPLRSLFAREDREFTPWLAETANLARLSRTLGFEMNLTATEASTGRRAENRPPRPFPAASPVALRAPSAAAAP